MSNKFLNAIILSTLLFGASTTHGHASQFDWAYTETGQCYKNINEYIISKYQDEDAQEDENLIQETIDELSTNNTSYVWFIDNTPSSNPTRLLFENRKSKSCIILTAPIAEEIFFVPQRGVLPETIFTVSSRFPDKTEKSILYKKKIKSNIYYPFKCTIHNYMNNISRQVSCSSFKL